MKKKRIARRALLRGAAGAALGLPLLNVMGDGPSAARADGSGAPSRFVMGFGGGCSLGHDRDAFRPTRLGRGYDLPQSLEALGSGIYDVQEHVSVVSNMSMPYATPEERPSAPATRSVVLHEGAPAPLLAGRTSWSDRYYQTMNDDGEVVDNPSFQRPPGPTATHAVAEAIGADRAFPVLDYSLDGSRSISLRRDETEWVTAERSPRQAYNALVGASSSETENPDDIARRDLLFRRRLSVLDLVKDDASRLSRQLGRDDGRRLDQHFTELRDLENRIVALNELDGGAYCTDFADPGADPSGSHPGYDGQDERGAIFNELIAKAFACDMSRSVGMRYSSRQSRMNLFPIIGFDADLHSLTHSGADRSYGDYASQLNAQMAAVVGWHVKQFAHLVRLLADTPDGPGTTLIDHTAMVFLTEGGWGYDPQTGRSAGAHSTENYSMLVAGHAGGLQPGRHIVAENVHPTVVTTSAMSAVGAGSRLNEVDGVLGELFG